MRISLNWLRELVTVTLEPVALAELLTVAGFEVESIEDRRTWADGVVVGRVLSCDRHPNANKLRVCQVDVGASNSLQIVCGAANVGADLWVPVAPVGTYLPIVDLKIRASKLRGIVSEGMICSLAELGLAKESEGIHSFEAGDFVPGQDVRPLLGLNDVVLDVTSTANRADALSMVGLAREVAALTGAKLQLPQPPEFSGLKSGAVVLRLPEPQACPTYIGTVVEQIQICPSPPWLQQRLQMAGIRPISNVVDITNYVLLEWGQPLHAFDGDRLRDVTPATPLQIGVDFAQAGETLETLDGQKRILTAQTLVITANGQPAALAGVMGGAATEVHGGTQNLFLEAAIFDPVAVRRSARSQGLCTEASTRYERGVNQAELMLACRRSLQLLTELASGVIVSQAIATTQVDQNLMGCSIQLRLDRVNQVLGPVHRGEDIGELEPQEITQILTALGCTVAPSDQEAVWTVTVPPYRCRDLEREIDLIEEIARLYGYDNFCDDLPDGAELGSLPRDQVLVNRLREAFRSVGLTELIHYSLVKPEGEQQITLANPLLVEYAALRTELLSGLLQAFQYNLEQGNGALNGFEIGRVFWRDEEGLQEADALAGILGGDRRYGKWVHSGQEHPLTWYEAKGMLESVFQRLGLTVEYQPTCQDVHLHPGRTASLWLEGQRLGIFGQFHPQLRQTMALPEAVYGFELNLDLLLEVLEQGEVTQVCFRPYSPYPTSDRDIAFFAPVSLSVAAVERAVTRAAGALLVSVTLFDEYRGGTVPLGQRSLAFRLVYGASDRTLTDEVVETAHQKIRDALEEEFQVSLRS